MTTMPGVDEAETLLTKFLAYAADQHYPSELREALFEGAAMAFGLLVNPMTDAQCLKTAERRLRVSVEQLHQAFKLPYARYLRSLSAKVPCLSVVGIHFVDPEFGRYSRIWIPPTRSCPPSSQQAGRSAAQLLSWWRSYPDLWLRVYKQLLHPSTSLLNAFEQELLHWPGRGMLVQWDTKEQTNREGVSTTNAAARRELFKRVSLRRAHNARFIDETRAQLRELHRILSERSVANLPPPDKPAFEVVAEQLSREVERACLVTALKDIRESYFRQILAPGEARQEFLSILADLGGTDGKIHQQLIGETNALPHGARRRVTEGVEVLQTILFNEPGFCDESGLLFIRGKVRNARIYLVLGLDGEAFRPDLTRYSQIDRTLRRTLDAVKNVLSKARRSPSIAKDEEDDLVVGRALGHLQHISDKRFDGGPYRFIRLALHLSREAIHEGRELRFLMGYGHAETPEIRCRKPIRPLAHLAGEGVDVDLLVHFIKSYFSLFAREGGVLWFDEKGRFHGLYGRAPQDAREDWLSDWGQECYFVRIGGKGRFDVLEAYAGNGGHTEHRPRVRVVGDTVVDLQSIAAIQYMTTLAGGAVFEADPEAAKSISKLIWTVADRLREEGQGAGLVVTNLDATVDGSWRLDIESQVKSLVPDLPDFTEPIARIESISRDLANLADRVCQLAELDGAVYLHCKKGKLWALPARHFFPLVASSPKAPPELLNFYKWADAGNRTLEDNAADGLGELERVLQSTNARIVEGRLRRFGSEGILQKALEQAKKLKAFSNLNTLKRYTACIAGRPRVLRETRPNSAIRQTCKDLSFLTSAGTRHHSLWGITLSSRQRLFAVSLSQDGRVSVFWDGRLIPSPKHRGTTR